MPHRLRLGVEGSIALRRQPPEPGFGIVRSDCDNDLYLEAMRARMGFCQELKRVGVCTHVALKIASLAVVGSWQHCSCDHEPGQTAPPGSSSTDLQRINADAAPNQ